MIPKIFFSVVLVTIASVTALTQNTAPDARVRAFYAYSNSRSSTFNRRHIELRKKWYTPALYAAFLKQNAEDQAHLKNIRRTNLSLATAWISARWTSLAL